MSYKRINHWARVQPTKTAFISNDVVFSYSAFANAIEAVRRELSHHGLPVGATAIIFSRNRGNAWIIVFALRSLGLTTIVVQSIAQAVDLKLTNVVALVVPQHDEVALGLRNHSYDGAKVVSVPSVTLTNNLSGDLVPVDSSVPFGDYILFTSGTTGFYKKVLVRGEREDQRNLARANAYSLTHRAVYHAAKFGLWTTVGFRIAPAVWHVGGTVLFEGRDTISRFFKYPISFAILIPPMLRELVENFGAQRRRDDCELMITAGFLSASVANNALGLITNKLSVSYGSTELSTPALLSRSPEPLDWLQPSLDRLIRILDEDGSECAIGQEGELQVQLMDIDCEAYLEDAETTAKVFRDGFFCPGDMALRRPDGRIQILGRKADVLNIEGEKVAVAPIEARIQELLKVEEVCIFSGLNDAGAHQLVIAIQADTRLPQAELEEVARHFSSFETIRFTFRKKFPRTGTGTQKTKRALLRQMVFKSTTARCIDP